MLPVARGANGQPPVPPIDASSTMQPAAIAATALAKPVLRVLWKWQPTGTPRATGAPTSVSTCDGTPTPTVSARTTSSGSLSATRAARSSTCAASTAPANGQPNATDSVTVTRTPSFFACATIAADVSSAPATVVFWLRPANSSVTGKA